MEINQTSAFQLQVWSDPNGKPPPEETAVALRLSITERVAEVNRKKENYITALSYLADVPLPYDCRLPTTENECLEIERCAWRDFIDTLRLRPMLSIKAREELDEQLNEHRRGYGGKAPLPPFTVENVFGFFEQTCRRIPEMIGQAVGEVFKWLTPSQRWTGCKTSNEFKIGEKVVVTSTAERTYSSERFRVNHYRRPEVDALGNVLWMLDGKGVRKQRVDDKDADAQACGPYSSAWEKAWFDDGLEVYEDDYLTAKPFKNGNVHIVFKRPDLVTKINQAGNEYVLQAAGKQETRGFSH